MLQSFSLLVLSVCNISSALHFIFDFLNIIPIRICIFQTQTFCVVCFLLYWLKGRVPADRWRYTKKNTKPQTYKGAQRELSIYL